MRRLTREQLRRPMKPAGQCKRCYAAGLSLPLSAKLCRFCRNDTEADRKTAPPPKAGDSYQLRKQGRAGKKRR